MRTMGFDPIRARAFRDYLRVLRGLLRGEEVDYTVADRTRPIRFLHRELGFVDVEHEIPIWVAANGPLALRAAGAYGDGRISAGLEAPDGLRSSLEAIGEGAKAAGRAAPLGEDFHTAALCYSCVLRPGESLSDDRVIDACGSMAMAGLHFWWELAEESGSDAFVPDPVRPDWERYLAFVRGLGIPRDRIHLRLHEGHCTYLVADERRFVTPAVIRASGGLVGTPEEIVQMLQDQQRAGLKEVTLLPPMAYARELLAEFSDHVMSRM
jgi:alkanesulfonate monooxygenase SsuD/methylene tetrahydromethanopterin reductase-like flavin-dependent oxidoreductase (luciferase family)